MGIRKVVYKLVGNAFETSGLTKGDMSYKEEGYFGAKSLRLGWANGIGLDSGVSDPGSVPGPSNQR